MIDTERLLMPDTSISCDGDAIDTGALTSVRVRRESAAPAACELRFSGEDGTAAATHVGGELSVSLDGVAVFRGDILTAEHHTAADGRSEVVVRAQDRSHRWRQDSRTRAFVDLSVGEIIAEVAAEAGLGCSHDATGPRWPRYLQDGRSTLAMVRDLAARAGLTWQVDAAGETVRVREIGAAERDEVVLTHGVDLLEAETRVTAVGAQAGWRVRGWDPVTGAIPEGAAPAPGDAPGTLSPGDGVRVGAVLPSDDHAVAAARALGAATGATARSARAVALGDPRIVPGTPVRLEGVGGDPGPYLLTEVEHIVDGASGYVCVLGSSRPEARSRGAQSTWPRSAALAPGEVIDIDDPEGRGRVRVALVGLDGLESEWLPVLALGAGEDKGLTCQPDLGDTVLVAHGDDDPGRGVVLGSLRVDQGSEPGAGVTGGAVGAYALRLPTGQTLRLAKERDELSLENSRGSRLVLDRSGIRLHAAGNLVVEAPGRRITLRADAIELERG